MNRKFCGLVGLFIGSQLLPVFSKNALEAPVESIVEKSSLPPSGDPHDYHSLAIYWWPNPLTKIPYQRKDGVRNPEADQYDAPRLKRFIRTIASLVSSYQATQDRRFLENAARRVRVWFLDPATKMNPNFNHAQFIPGIRNGSYHGIIEANALAESFVPSWQVLSREGALSPEEDVALKEWFVAFLNWLETSPLGRQEDAQNSNQSLWYDYQRVIYAQATGQEAKARAILQEVGPKRIARQIEADGSMPAELKRTKSYSYMCYALRPLIHLAILGQSHGVDLSTYKSPNGGSLPQALIFTLKHAHPPSEWPDKQITPLNPKQIQDLTALYLQHFPNPQLQALLDAVQSAENAPEK